MNIIDRHHPFYKPMWRRVLIVTFCLAWGVFEFLGGNPAWAMLFVVAGLYSGRAFFVDFPSSDEEGSE